MKHALPQMDALAAWAADNPADAQPMTELTACWYVDQAGVVHGKNHRHGSVAHAGKLGAVLNAPRCPDKGCATASRIAGVAGVEWASYAQRITGFAAELVALEANLETSPWVVAGKTAELLSAWAESDLPAPASDVLAARNLHDRAVAAWHDPARCAASVREAARQVLIAREDGPVRALQTVAASRWELVGGSLQKCDGSSRWVENFLSQHAADPDAYARAALKIERIGQLDTPEFRASLDPDISLVDALVAAHIAHVEKLARSIPTWWQVSEAELLGDNRVALVAVPGPLRGALSEYEMYRDCPDSPLLLAPVAVGELITNQQGEVGATVLDQAPPPAVLEIARTLTRDAHAGGTGLDLDEIVAAAYALTP